MAAAARNTATWISCIDTIACLGLPSVSYHGEHMTRQRSSPASPHCPRLALVLGLPIGGLLRPPREAALPKRRSVALLRLICGVCCHGIQNSSRDHFTHRNAFLQRRPRRVGEDRRAVLWRPCRPDRADASNPRRGAPLDRRGPLLARAELLHAAAGTRGYAACDLCRLAAARHLGRALPRAFSSCCPALSSCWL